MIVDIIIIVFLMVTAIILLLLEIFLLPGITIACIGSILFGVGGVAYAYSVGPTAGHVTLISSAITFGVLFLWLLRAKSFSKVALNTDVGSKMVSSRDLGIQPGDEGETLSRLAPIGKARIKDIVVEAKSTSDFIDENIPVVVVRVDGYNVIVKQKE